MKKSVKQKVLQQSVIIIVAFFLLVHDTALVMADDPSASDIQDNLDSLQKKLDKANQKKQVLVQDLNHIKTSLGATVAMLNKTKILLKDTTDVIRRKELEVQLLEENIQYKKEMLTGLIQEIYWNADKPLVAVVLGEDDFSTALDEAETMTSLSVRVKGILDDVESLKGQTESEKTNLLAMKQKHEREFAQKAAEQQSLVSDQAETQEDIKDQEKIIARLKKELSELQGDLAKLSGKSYDAKDIRDAVEFASKRTGVPEGVLYGFLKMETNLGANTGKCTYEEAADVAISRYKVLLKKNKNWQASIDTLHRRQNLFYDLMKKLNYSKDKKVSCSPASSAYIGQGGAMGIPQFMSDVWIGYSAKISAYTGHGTPDPWNLTDGVMAMALKLQKAGASSSSESVIRRSSISYLGTFNNNYYSGIVYWSKNYKALFS
jgi:membrane-bound lytic murein transglycosylase B